MLLTYFICYTLLSLLSIVEEIYYVRKYDRLFDISIFIFVVISYIPIFNVALLCVLVCEYYNKFLIGKFTQCLTYLCKIGLKK